MTTYSIDDGHGTRLTTGLQPHEAHRVAQRMADDRHETIYLYAGDEDYTAIEPRGATADATIRRLLSELDDLAGSRDDGTLGIIVRQAVADDPDVTADDIRAIWADATADAETERLR